MRINTYFRKIVDLLNLEAELEDSETVYKEIEKAIIFRGTNLWILIFAIIVASVGLNMNSTAVIIGAMLISPLMGPINGMGYSIATYNGELFQRSVKNFTFAILAGLATSTLYFAISPVSTAHSELLARTSPTIYDVLIALFGGLAGIVAISSKLKGNVIPGVAIATALMPPLCTAGYGLATSQYNFFFGAFYLFTINTIFIALASVFISQILRFPIRSNIAIDKKRRINHGITAVILIVLIPSIYFGYNLVKQEDFLQRSNQYVSNISIFEGKYLLNYQTDPKKRTINLVFGGTPLDEAQKKAITEKANDFKLGNSNIIIEQGLTVGRLNDETIEMYKLREQINKLNMTLEKKEMIIDSIRHNAELGKVILNEINTLYPNVLSCSYSQVYSFNKSMSQPEKFSLVIFSLKNEINPADKLKIRNWVEKRLDRDSVRVIFE